MGGIKLNQDKYLIKYYKNNNPVTERIAIKKKIITRTLILVICSIAFFVMLAFSDASKFKGEISLIDTLIPLKIIMIISSIIGLIGVISLFLSLISRNYFHHFFIKIPFKVKRSIFVLLDWFSILPICVVITFFCFSYLFIITPVSGDSMIPNISNGEHVFVSYNTEIKRGSVVILEVNKDDNFHIDETSHYIKRIIGLPGDRVKWINNKLYINDEAYNEPYFPKDYFGTAATNNFDGLFRYIDENGNEQVTEIIPEGYYFVMGDNRPISKDSRSIGLIPEKNIIGVATYHMNFIIPRGKIK